MKKKLLLFAGALMLTGVIFTTGCKDAVENALDCYNCNHPDFGDTEVCTGGIYDISYYQDLGYTCTKK